MKPAYTSRRSRVLAGLVHSLMVVMLCGAASNVGAETRGTIRDDGVLLIDGKPTFLFGFYYEYRERTEAETIKAIETLSAAGMNLLFLNTIGRYDEFERLLDVAADAGIWTIAEGPDWKDWVTRFGQHPALLAWSVGDDMGDHDPAPVIAERTRFVHETAPGLLSYGSVSGWSRRWDEYSHQADLIGGQSYPIDYPFGNRPPGIVNPNAEPYHVFADGSRQAAWHGRPALANVQAFSWSEWRSNVPIWPAGIEVRNMNYQAIIAGMKGLLIYTWEGGSQGPSRGGDIWDACRQTAAELAPLAPMLAAQRPYLVRTGDDDAFAAYWTEEDGIMLMVVNASKFEDKELSLPLPVGVEGRPATLIGDAAATRPTWNEDGTLSVKLDRLGVAAFRLR